MQALREASGFEKNTAKKLEKSFEKPIDKSEILWYSNRAVPAEGYSETDIEN